MDVSVAELKKPLILPPPEGASFLSSWTRVITPGDSACTRLQSASLDGCGFSFTCAGAIAGSRSNQRKLHRLQKGAKEDLSQSSKIGEDDSAPPRPPEGR